MASLPPCDAHTPGKTLTSCTPSGTQTATPNEWTALMPNAEKDAALWVVTELSLSLPAPPPEGEPHPETTPVGPFESRAAADKWAFEYVGLFGSGSWSVAPLRPPNHPRHSARTGDTDA